MYFMVVILEAGVDLVHGIVYNVCISSEMYNRSNELFSNMTSNMTVRYTLNS